MFSCFDKIHTECYIFHTVQNPTSKTVHYICNISDSVMITPTKWLIFGAQALPEIYFNKSFKIIFTIISIRYTHNIMRYFIYFDKSFYIFTFFLKKKKILVLRQS